MTEVVTTLTLPPIGIEDRLSQLLAMRRFLDEEIASEREKIMSSSEWTWIRAAAELYGLDLSVVLADRGATAVKARQVAAWLMREDGLSFPAIGRAINRDHTTAIHAVRAIERDPALRAMARQLWDQQKGSAA